MDKNTKNLSAAIINDRRYSELKTSIYETLVNKDHATVVAVFQQIQGWAEEAEDNSFHETDRPKTTILSKNKPDTDEDLDDSLTEEEIKLRK
jgi:hypothetical protein